MTSPIRPANYREQIFMRRLRIRIDGNHNLLFGLTRIRGINKRFAQAVLNIAGLDPRARVGAVPEKDLEKIEDIILEPIEAGIPSYLVNRQKDLRDGEDKHLIGNRLELTVKRDIDRMKKIRSYKGVRHSLGLKVRGQRTKSTGRHGLEVGVVRAKLRQKQKQKKKKKKKKTKTETKKKE
jgi:small subunit ribosomal protein S13